MLFTDVAVDYFIREKLIAELAKQMKDRFAEPVCYYDEYAISRKEAAIYAGLGHLGKNALFFSRRFGFNCKIDLVLSSVSFDAYSDETHDEHRLGPCATCDACIPACPVQAYDGFAMVDPRACDELITPKWGTPSQMCRNCITSCPPSNTLLQRLYAAGAPHERRLDGVLEGSDDASAKALYERIPENMQAHPKPHEPLDAEGLLPLVKLSGLSQDAALDIQQLFSTQLPSSLQAHADDARAIGCRYHVVIDGQGSWFIDATSGGPDCRPSNGEPAQCTISVDADGFRKLYAEPHLYGSELFMSGQLKVKGRVGAAMQLIKLLYMTRDN